jgi:hypothetical protein
MTKKEKDFDELKSNYLKFNSQCQRLITEMRENLISRGAKGCPICLDEKPHCLDSNNVEDLMAIDGWLRQFPYHN